MQALRKTHQTPRRFLQMMCGNTRKLFQFGMGARQLTLNLLPLSNVHTRTDIAEKSFVVSIARNAGINQPAIFAVMMPQTVFHRKGFPPVKGRYISIKTALIITRMHPVCPTIALFLLQGTIGKFQPAFIKIVTLLIRTRLPDQHRRRIRQQPETLLALTQLCRQFSGHFSGINMHTHVGAQQQKQQETTEESRSQNNPHFAVINTALRTGDLFELQCPHRTIETGLYFYNGRRLSRLDIRRFCIVIQ